MERFTMENGRGGVVSRRPLIAAIGIGMWLILAGGLGAEAPPADESTAQPMSSSFVLRGVVESFDPRTRMLEVTALNAYPVGERTLTYRLYLVPSAVVSQTTYVKKGGALESFRFTSLSGDKPKLPPGAMVRVTVLPQVDAQTGKGRFEATRVSITQVSLEE